MCKLCIFSLSCFVTFIMHAIQGSHFPVAEWPVPFRRSLTGRKPPPPAAPAHVSVAQWVWYEVILLPCYFLYLVFKTTSLSPRLSWTKKKNRHWTVGGVGRRWIKLAVYSARDTWSKNFAGLWGLSFSRFQILDYRCSQFEISLRSCLSDKYSKVSYTAGGCLYLVTDRMKLCFRTTYRCEQYDCEVLL